MAVQIDHPFVQHKLALIRDAETGHKRFRELAKEITQFICYVVIPILRAGIGMLDGILDLLPTARVGFVGLYRDEETKEPVTYYERFPPQIKGGTCIVIDPMLATGGSTVAALDLLKEQGAEDIIVICIVTCPEGIAAVESAHPDVPVFAASIDDGLDERSYIVPGLGDAGDRLFGTSHH